MELFFEIHKDLPREGPGAATNHIEVIVKPTSSAGSADMYIRINNKTLTVLYGQKAEPAQVGLALGWHSVGAAFDNWEFEELEP